MGLRLEQENADSDGYSFLALKAGEFVFTTSELFSEDSETLYPSHKQVYYGQVFLMQVAPARMQIRQSVQPSHICGRHPAAAAPWTQGRPR